jgi:hypothetical protein
VDRAASPLGREPTAGVIDEPPAHLGRDQPEERFAGVDRSRSLAQQAHVGIVQQRRRLQGVSVTFAA